MKPLKHADLMVGGDYLHVGVDAHGGLSLSRITVLSEPDAEGRFRSRITYGSSGRERSYETENFLEGLGCPHKPRKWMDNYHRLFANYDENRRFLADLVRLRQLHVYLALIDVPDPQAAIEHIKVAGERFDRMVEEVDKLTVLDGSPENDSEIIDLFAAELETHRAGRRH